MTRGRKIVAYLLLLCTLMTLMPIAALVAWAEELSDGAASRPDAMEDILSSGNFGHKDQDRARSLNMLPNWEKDSPKVGKLRLLCRTLRHSAQSHRPQYENKPVCLFFSMCGRAIRYVFLFIRGKRPNLLKAASHADTRRSIYEQLHLFETE